MKKVHMITASAAFAAGLTAGLIAAGAPEVHAFSKSISETIRAVLTPVQKTSVEAFTVDTLKDAAQIAFGPNVITLDDAKKNGISVSWHNVDTPEERAEIACHVVKMGEATFEVVP